ncbi:hypothetical protein [Streptococcus hyointestinalis]|nr:hypothetical protein [Streptococcus hyointestinalis]
MTATLSLSMRAYSANAPLGEKPAALPKTLSPTLTLSPKKEYGYTRLPMMFLQDKDGKLIMQDLDMPTCHFVEEYKEKLTGKMYPKEIAYTFRDGDKTAHYTIRQIEDLESRDGTAGLAAPIKAMLKLKGLHPSTSRNYARGKLTLLDGDKIIERQGHMIYEFVYMGETVKDKMEHD